MSCSCPELSKMPLGRGLVRSRCSACVRSAAAKRRRIRMKERRAAADNADVDSNRSESEESDSGDGGMAGRIAFVDDCIGVDTAGCVGVEVHDDSEAVKRKSIENISAIPEHVNERVSNDCGHMLSSEDMEETVCCVCDGLYPLRDMLMKNLSKCGRLVEAMQQRLKAPADIPTKLQEYYSVSDISSSFKGLLLSRSGIKVRDTSVIMQMCRSCSVSLLNKRLKSCPKFAIANGLYIGVLPDKFSDTTMTENAMLHLAQPMRYFAVVRGGKHASLRSHAYMFRANPECPAQLLFCRVISEGVIRVVLIGAMTTHQKARMMKKFEVRSERLQSQLGWYRKHNDKFNDSHTVDQSFDGIHTDVVIDRTIEGDARSVSDDTIVADLLDAATQRFNAPSPAHENVHGEEDEACEQQAVGIVTDFEHEHEIEAGIRLLQGELFPYGRGGYDEPRNIKIGLKEYIRHWLWLSTRKHVQHHGFLLTAFDVIARHNALDAVYLRGKLAPYTAISAAAVTREDLMAHLEFTKARLVPQQASGHGSAMLAGHKKVTGLFSSIYTGLRAHWGSSEERIAARTNLLSMPLTFGQPAIFFTISPSTSTLYRIANLAGVIKRDLLDIIEADVTLHLEYTRARLGMIATANPVSCARYFDHVMYIVISVLLNWDRSANAARPGRGIFGQVTAFYGSTESQSSTGDLHCHMIVWVTGFLKTVTEYNNLCKSSVFKKKLVDYVDSIVTTDVPFPSDGKCPECSANALEAVEFDQRAYQELKRRDSPFATAQCCSCRRVYGGIELINQCLERGAQEQKNPAESLSEAAVFARAASSKPFQLAHRQPGMETFLSTRSLLAFQSHHWYHSRSCFKRTKRTPSGKVCRMFFPKKSSRETQWTSTDCIELGRKIGNEYINSYVPVISNTLKCNHDVKFLGAGEGLHKSYYMMKYCTKPQNEIENPAALHLHAYDKASSNCDELADSFSAGRKRIQSMCCTLSNGQEVAAPLAALYLLRESPFYSSHEFAALHLDSIVNVLFNGEQDTVVLEEVHGGAYKPVNVLIDYTCRPIVMDDVSLMEFKKCWEKQKDQKGVLFGPSHPQYHTHSIHRRATDAVVTVFSSRLPDVRRRDTESDVKLNYCKRLLALFVPFRLSSEFPQSDEKVMDMFVSWWNTSAADSARIYADYSEDYYVSRDVADSKGDDDLIHYDQCTVSDSIVNDGENDSVSSEASDNECDPSNMLNFPDCPTLNDEFVKGLARGVETTEHVASTILCDDHVEYNMDLSVLDDAIHEQEVSTDHVNPNIATTYATSTFQDAPTRIEVMNAVEGSEKWEPPIATAEAVVLEPCSTLREVSRHFNLNEKQHKTFVVVGRRLLEALSIDEKMSSREPLVSFLGGLPGAGKSQVIKSLQALALSWRSLESVGTVSYQGIAAQAANGETIHKFFGWGLRGFSKTKQVTLEQREKITKLKLLILDEISTTDVKIIGMIDSCLRHIRNEPNLLFGGVDVLFVGDWLQQLPVAGVPAYVQTPPCLSHQPRSKRGDYFLRSRGIQAYQQVTNVVMLSQNVRHQGDPEWRDILNRWRTGNYVKEDIDRVNTVSYGEDWRVRNMESSSFCPIIVASNALRSQFNAQSLRAYCQVHTITLHKFSAKLYRRKKPLDRTRKDGLRTIRDDKTGNMPIVLELAFGAPVQCTKNASRALKLANGSIGFVAGFMASDTEVATSISRQQYEEVLHSEPPEVVFVKLRGYEQVHFLPILPVGVVPVRLRLEPSVEIKLPNRTFCIDIEQVPLTPAFSLTTEKCQGMTLEKMVLAPLRHETRVSPQRSSFYVATTRVKLLRQLYLMEKLSLEALEYFTPNAAAVAETQRLESLEIA